MHKKQIKKILFNPNRPKLFHIPAKYTLEEARIMETKGIFKKKRKK